MTLRNTRAIGLSKFSPRWVKVICLRLTKNDIERSLNALLATIDESELSPEQVKALRECVDRINLARGKGMQACAILIKDVSMLIWLELLLSENLAGEIEFKNLIKGKPIPYMRGALAAPIPLTGRHQRRFLKPKMIGLKLKGGHRDEMVRFERGTDID